MHLQYSCYFCVHINLELSVLISEKKYSTEYDHGYMYISKHIVVYADVVFHERHQLSIPRVEVRPVGLNNNISERRCEL